MSQKITSTLFLLIAGGLGSVFASHGSQAETQLPQRDLFAAFYYTWYVAEAWEHDWDAQPVHPYHIDGARPLRLYGSDDPNIFDRHLDWAEEFGIDILVLSWTGPGTRADVNLRQALAATPARKVKFAILYESGSTLESSHDWEKTIDFSSAPVRSRFFEDMSYLQRNYYDRFPHHFTIDGQSMLYLYLVRNYRNLPTGFAESIRSRFAPRSMRLVADVAYFGANRHPVTAHNVWGVGPEKLLFDAYTAYNMYRPSTAADGEPALQFTTREAEPVFQDWADSVPFYPQVLPSYKDFRYGHGRLTGTKDEFRESLCRARSLKVWGRFSDNFQRVLFITTFNEWYEGTSVEPGMARRPGSRDYGFDYLEAVRDVALRGWCG